MTGFLLALLSLSREIHTPFYKEFIVPKSFNTGKWVESGVPETEEERAVHVLNHPHVIPFLELRKNVIVQKFFMRWRILLETEKLWYFMHTA
jgi:hypothetical protein